MKRIAIVLVILFSLLLMPTPVSAAGVGISDTTGDGTWEDNVWEVSLYPNEVKTTTITLCNSSRQLLKVWVTVQPESLDGGNLIFELDQTNFVMSRGSSTDVFLTVRANGSVTPGDYTATLEIKSEIPSAPSGGGVGGGDESVIYGIETNLFGTEGKVYTGYDGGLAKTVEATSEDGNLSVTIPKGTIILGKEGNPLKELQTAVSEDLPEPPKDANIIGLAYDFNPSGATFEPPITLTWTYDPNNLPKGVSEEYLTLAFYDGIEWVGLGCIVDIETSTITALVSHFTTFAIIGTEILEPIIEPVPVLIPTPIPAPAPIPVPVPALPEVVPTVPEAPIDLEVVEPLPEELPEPLVPEGKGLSWLLITGIVIVGLAVVVVIVSWMRNRVVRIPY